MGRAWIGTSGWSYPHWRERFFPRGLAAAHHLAYYAERFPTVEVNTSFYRLLCPEVVEHWRASVPAGFIFAVKGSRYVTHMLKLGGGPAPLGNFFAMGILRLGAQLGPILWQLPPQLRFDRARAAAFLSLLPRDIAAAERLARRHDRRVAGRCALSAPDGRDAPLRHAIEVREASWLSAEALGLLSEQGIALVAADTAKHHPFSLARTVDAFAYVRLHGAESLYASRYTDAGLDLWADRLRPWLAAGSDVYVYFDNDNKAYAPGDARRLTDRIGSPAVGAAARAPRPSPQLRTHAPRTPDRRS
jgi:uncharacterized protein YecE (DUF72 family)